MNNKRSDMRERYGRQHLPRLFRETVDDSQSEIRERNSGMGLVVGCGLGIVIGAGFGVASGNLASGIGFGVGIGVALGLAFGSSRATGRPAPWSEHW